MTHSLGATPQLDFDYAYNAVGNIASIVQPLETRSFGYDDLQRLISGGTAAAPESYAYDPEGNRTVSHLSASHTTDIANRLTEDDAFCYAYDPNGNLETKTARFSGACTGALTTYTYDAQDQLVRIDLPGGTVVTYRYDGLGRRIEKDVGGTVTKYVYEGGDTLLKYDGLDVLQARYSHGSQADQPLAQERGGQSYFYQADHQGSVRQLTDALGTPVNDYTYDSYGRIEGSIEAVPNPYLYTGREYDPESGFYYHRARYYDAEIGRFITEDPIGFGGRDTNAYRYVSDNPVNLRDPNGKVAVPLAPLLVPIGVGLAIAYQSNPDILKDISRLLNDILDDGGDGATGEESGDKSPDQSDEPQCIGNNPRPSRKGLNTDLPGGREEAERLFDELTSGQSRPDPETGGRVGDNEVRIRIGKDGRFRVDVPADVGIAGKHETIHFNN